jgi:hypothetical protein
MISYKRIGYCYAVIASDQRERGNLAITYAMPSSLRSSQ